MNWNDNLPDTSLWQPQSKKRDTLSNALMLTCQISQRRIVARAEAEVAFNVHNFDSGSGVEDVIREEFSHLLPQRYSVNPGIVNDSLGNTAGDCDMLIRDHTWSPAIKPGATSQSRRFHFPIEGVYAASEFKQSLGFEQLDEAMKKLATLARLDRKDNPFGHITENQHITNFDKPGHTLNPLHTSVLAIGLKSGLTFDDIVNRFGAINAMLDRRTMVTMLCVLDHGTAWYSVASGNPYDADFMTDRNQQLILQVNKREPDSAFYRLYVLLSTHLTRSVLGLTNVYSTYGSPPPNRTVKCYPNAAFNRIDGGAS